MTYSWFTCKLVFEYFWSAWLYLLRFNVTLLALQCVDLLQSSQSENMSDDLDADYNPKPGTVDVIRIFVISMKHFYVALNSCLT